jgi:hypothetical protein
MKQRLSARQRSVLRQAPLPPPPGFRVRKVAQRADGGIIAVQSVPTGKAKSPHVPDGHEVSGVSTLFGSDGRVVGQWVKTRQLPSNGFDMLDAITKRIRADVPPAPRTYLDLAQVGPDNRLNAFVWGDPHIGLLSHARETGQNFDLKIACNDLRRSADLLIAKAPRAGHALFVDVGDLWHAESDKQVTPRGGNKLDVDGRKSKILEQGLATLEYMLNQLLASHETVTAVIVPGNHDPDMAVITRVYLEAVYRNEPRMTIRDNANPWMYCRFGTNLFGFNHGDKKVKPQELGEVMLADRPKDTGECEHRVFFTGHVHHKNVQEFRWGRWESFNSLCAQDFWHHSEGYRSARLVECITFDSQYGERSRARVTHRELVDSEPAC